MYTGCSFLSISNFFINKNSQGRKLSAKTIATFGNSALETFLTAKYWRYIQLHPPVPPALTWPDVQKLDSTWSLWELTATGTNPNSVRFALISSPFWPCGHAGHRIPGLLQYVKLDRNRQIYWGSNLKKSFDYLQICFLVSSPKSKYLGTI